MIRKYQECCNLAMPCSQCALHSEFHGSLHLKHFRLQSAVAKKCDARLVGARDAVALEAVHQGMKGRTVTG
jgi:hypothetical protein